MKKLKNLIDDFIFIISREYIYVKSIVKFIIKKIKKNKVWLFIIFSLVAFFLGVIFVISDRKNDEIHKLKDTIIEKETKIEVLQEDLIYAQATRRIELMMIKEKVNRLDEFLSRMYPYYNYKEKVQNVLDKKEKIEELPEELLNIYVDRHIEAHGVKNYELTYKNLIFPMDYETTFVATKNSEFGRYRPIRYMNYRHAGLDMNNLYTNSVFAIYNAKVYQVGYEESGGWYIKLKFLYTKKDGKKIWLFCVYRHLAEIYIKQGDSVKQGDIIANMGNTGWLSLGKHLHFEIWEYSGRGTYWYCKNFVQNSTWNNKVIDRLYP